MMLVFLIKIEIRSQRYHAIIGTSIVNQISKPENKNKIPDLVANEKKEGEVHTEETTNSDNEISNILEWNCIHVSIQVCRVVEGVDGFFRIDLVLLPTLFLSFFLLE